MNSPTHSPITQFCEKRQIPLTIRDAFSAYIRTIYADRFMLRGDTDTVRLMIGKMNDEQLEKMWMEFLSEMKKLLPHP